MPTYQVFHTYIEFLNIFLSDFILGVGDACQVTIDELFRSKQACQQFECCLFWHIILLGLGQLQGIHFVAKNEHERILFVCVHGCVCVYVCVMVISPTPPHHGNRVNGSIMSANGAMALRSTNAMISSTGCRPMASLESSLARPPAENL